MDKLKMLLLIFVWACSAGLAYGQEAVGADQPLSKEEKERYPDPVPLPKFMKGRWYNPDTHHGNTIEIEVLEMVSPKEARIEITWWPYCRKATSSMNYEGKRQVWRFRPVNCSNDQGELKITARVKPVEGVKKMEGWYGQEGKGRTVYLEWEQ
jgi:hypothetical protein